MQRRDGVIEVDERIYLRPVGNQDLELLRQWKNLNREMFFHRDAISAEQQEAWYRGYESRSDDHMFIAMDDGEPFGCLGYRLLDGNIDFYNVIRGRNDRGHGAMHEAMRRLVTTAMEQYPERPTIVRVIMGNPAIAWYEKCGFIQTDGGDGFIIMRWIPSSDERRFGSRWHPFIRRGLAMLRMKSCAE